MAETNGLEDRRLALTMSADQKSAPPEAPGSGTTGFKIEDDVPLPDDGGTRFQRKYPFLEMKVGQSVFIPTLHASQLAGAIAYAQHRLGGTAKFVRRSLEGGTRVWRVK